ncbi:MAG: FHA domain-containing protein [Lachnospiraceae bacterium]|nr:FHA domain-containing protein [Lachnospiraceae bacterium]
MNGKIGNQLIVIENGQLSTYMLDDRLVWEVGRASKDNMPDIRLYAETVSRRHGKFENMNGIWFYVDHKGKNGTVYRGKHIQTGVGGRTKPIMLKDRDVFIFGGGETAVINYKTVWAMFVTHGSDERWRVADTKGSSLITFTDGVTTVTKEKTDKGTVIDLDHGMAIYMGDITYLAGDITLI